jgi:hypothetical protein
MKKILLSLAALSLAACSQPGEQQQTAATDAAGVEITETAQAPIPSLEGEWVVEQANGKAPDQIWPMTAEATKDHFTIVSECRKMSWAFKQDRNFVVFTPAAGVECGRVRSPAEILANNTVKLANTAVFADEGRTVQISGPGGTISMTRR